MEQLLTRKQVAAYLSVSDRTVRRLRLPTVRIGRLVRYRLADVVRWVEARKE